MRKTRLAIVVSHPIQHFVHFYRALAACEDFVVNVIFCSRLGLEEYFDKDMGTVIRWEDNMVAGFDHEFLPEASSIKDTHFLSIDNPSVTAALRMFWPDVVMVYGYTQLTQLRVLAWCRFRRVPVLMVTDSNAVTKRSAFKTFLRQTGLRLALSQVSGFLTVGDQNERALAELGVPRARMHRTPFTIDEQRYRMARKERRLHRAQVLNQYGIPDDAFVGIAVGKLIPRKRIQDAVQAFSYAAKMVGSGRNMHLIVCGSGPELDRIEEQVRLGAPVTLAGFVNIDKLPDHFAAADVLVHTASRDAHPLICSEAACIGLPMILSDQVGTIGQTDISRRDENALVYPCGDISALTGALLRLATDASLLDKMVEASLRIFEECCLSASVDGLQKAVNAVAARDASL
jgi:glycosyltransferase involved in cell wall biosynthesis